MPTPVPHAVFIVFLFALGACVGSFLNVVVWRLPRVQAVQGEGILRGFLRSMVALSEPPSHCPQCNQLLKWYDNIPVIGWIKLWGKCRFCRQPFSVRYPIVEGITGLIFAGYYIAFFVWQLGPCVGIFNDGRILHRPLYINEQWWVYGLDMMLLSGLLAASLIDAELFIIPIEIPWIMACIGLIVHTIFDTQVSAGNLIVGPVPAAMALGGAVGLIMSFILLARGVLQASFPDGNLEAHTPMAAGAAGPIGTLDYANVPSSRPAVAHPPREWTPREARREIRKEIKFLLPPLIGAFLCAALVLEFEPIGRLWDVAVKQRWLAALLGSVFGGLVGGFVVWLTRILGTLGFGREAMGMGDVDLMLGVGAVLGAGAATIAFFLAPFFGIILALYLLLSGKKRELPYGPYLSLATAFVMLFYCPIAAYLLPGFANMGWAVGRFLDGLF